MRFLAARLAASAGLALSAAACLGAPSVPTFAPTPSPIASPSPTPAPSPLATPAAGTPSPATSPASPAPGLELVDVPEAGIRLPVPSAWERVGGDELADPATRSDIVARHPGMGDLMDAAELMGDRATPAFVAMGPATGEGADTPEPSVSVLVAQPGVSGPLLDFVAGFIADGFADAFGAPPPERSRLDTPVGEAVRLQFDMDAADGSPMVATAYVVGAAKGTLLITVMGPPDAAPASDPDAIVLAAAPLR